MAKQPTYVWVVWDQGDLEMEAPKLLATYTTRARAVSHVRSLRRDVCHPAGHNDAIDEDFDELRLRDFEEKITFDEYSLCSEEHNFSAERMEVQR